MDRIILGSRLFLLIIALAAGIASSGCKELKRYTMGARCGGPEKSVCPEGTHCDTPPGACGDATAEGVCVDLKDVCDGKYNPVCGCDGRTYGNDCTRLALGVQKARDGACEE